MLKIKTDGLTNSVALDEVAHNKIPQLYLHCLAFVFELSIFCLSAGSSNQP